MRRAAAGADVRPSRHKRDDSPEGGVGDATMGELENGVKTDRRAFRAGFTKNFFAAGEKTDLVSEPERLYNREIAAFASPKGTADCITAFGHTDFRDDVAKITIPTLIIHGDSDAIVPFEASGKRSHEAIAGSELVLIKDGPHGINASHPERFNDALLAFLAR